MSRAGGRGLPPRAPAALAPEGAICADPAGGDAAVLVDAPAVLLGRVGVCEGVALAGEGGVEVVHAVVDGQLLAGHDVAERPKDDARALTVHARRWFGVAVAVMVNIAGDLLFVSLVSIWDVHPDRV